MRTEKRWEKVILPKKLKNFTPRIQRDLCRIKFKPLPNDTIESCFIQGGVDTGKTLLACRMLLQEQKNLYLNPIDGYTSFDCLFTTVDDFFTELKATFNNDKAHDAKQMEDIINIYSNAHLVVFDDLGTNKLSEWTLEILYLIINRRYENLKKTIITSNFDLVEIGKICDARIASRIERQGETINKTTWR